MLLITTPTGNSGRHVAEAIWAGAKVRVLVRNRKKLSAKMASRVEIIKGDLRDETALSHAAKGAEAAFFCTPAIWRIKGCSRLLPFVCRTGSKCAQSIWRERLVTISGARGNPANIEPSSPLAAMEKTLDATSIATRHVRCGYFMENILYMVP